MYKVEIMTVVGSFIATVPEKISSNKEALDWIGGEINDFRPLGLEDNSVLAIWEPKNVIALRAIEDKHEGPGLHRKAGE